MKKLILLALLFQSVAYARPKTVNMWVPNENLNYGGACFKKCHQAGVLLLQAQCESQFGGQIDPSSLSWGQGSKFSEGFIQLTFVTYGTCVLPNSK